MLFWLLDINHEVADNEVEIRLWGKDDSGHTALVIARNTPYFYLLPKEEKNAEDVLREIEAERNRHREILRAELADKNYFGKPVKAIRITCSTPQAVDKYSKLLGKTPSIREHLEDDIRPATRYVVENGVNPSGWYRIDVSRTSRPRLKVEEAYETVKPPIQVERLQTPEFKTLALSTFCMAEKGSPDPSRDPVLAITITSDQGGTEQFVSNGRDDRQILEKFISTMHELDPDIIVGYRQNAFDWPYLIERAKKHKIKLSIDRTDSEPHRSVYGHISVTGRANIDLADISEDIPEVKIKTLGAVAEFLQVAKKRDIDQFQDIPTRELWKNTEKRKLLLENQRMRSHVTLEIARILLDFAIQMSSLTGLPLDQVAAAAVGYRVDSHLVMQTHRLNELIPRRREQPYIPYQGAIVLEPRPGMHENIAVLDFTSMYPNLMIMNNLSPDTYVSSEAVPSSEVIVAPEVGFRFRKEPSGFYKRVLENLIAIRKDVRKKLDQTDPKSVEHRMLREREKAIKVVTNACYGYAGWVGARWYVREVAESAAAFGRATLRRVFKMAENLDLHIVYADTDAIFVEYDKSKVKKLLEEVESEISMEIKIDKVYSRVLFTEAKKKCAGLLPDGTMDIVGLEVVRSDWSNVAKTVQEKILELVLKEKGAENAVKYLRRFIQSLRLGEIQLSDLVIWKTLTKPVESYQVKAPHVEVARTLLREGLNLKVGDKIGFVITKGTGKLYERAKPYSMASLNQVDIEYYVSNQILPAAMRILGMFGLKEDAILGVSSLSSLSRYTDQD